jgi:hypothetical protein
MFRSFFFNAVAILLGLAFLLSTASSGRSDEISTDLLIVGGTESGWGAAIQAARMGMKSITIVHDGNWLGGQYTEQGLACVDENKGVGLEGWGPDWHPMKRAFHRFGLFKELIDRIESHNEIKYGSKMPGFPMHGPTTFRPAEAERIFRDMLQPYVQSGQVQVEQNWVAHSTMMVDDGRTLVGMEFRSLKDPLHELIVHAPLTIDASDWGDAIQLSGAEYEVGPDPRSRYGEPGAPEQTASLPPNEMNPITWTMIVEQGGNGAPITAPAHYDQRQHYRGSTLAEAEFRALLWDRPVRYAPLVPWPPDGETAARQGTISTMRRIVEGSTSTDGRTSALLCFGNGQDYPLERLPHHVVTLLEKTEAGASMKNIVRMTPEQRQIVFDDAKAHSLGLLHYLQTYAHEKMPYKQNSLLNFHLSREFGTADHLPPKPYIRESLRLKALYMMREQDGRNTDGRTKDDAREAFARVLYPDGIFCWQFHYDFHRTGRAYLQSEGDRGPWAEYAKPGRENQTVSDRSLFPWRSLLPEKVDGLIGAQGNLGYSSIVSAAIRLHDQRIHIGQAAAATAALCWKHQKQPRELVWDRSHLEEMRHALCGGTEGVPILLWPYRDLPTEHVAFVAINRLAARRLLPMTRREVDFVPDAPATEKWQQAVVKLCTDYDVKLDFNSDAKFTRGEFARQLWEQIKTQSPPPWPRVNSDDADADGVTDVQDPLPFNASNSSWLNENALVPDAFPQEAFQK